MLWFKHLNNARNDPFIFDLRQRFGGEGYFVYFATLEIYANSFKPRPGWYLDVSIEYLKHEMGIYHLKKLLRIIEYIRSWPDVDGAKDRPALNDNMIEEIAPKWIAQLTGTRIALLIPTFTRLMDNYTAQKVRQMSQPNMPPGQSAKYDTAAVFRDIARDCEALAGLQSINGRPFVGVDFVAWCIKSEYHPRAIRDGTAALVKQIPRWNDIEDPWAYARGIIKTRSEYYRKDPIDPQYIKRIFGDFFNGTR
jgi:hypothetical protein